MRKIIRISLKQKLIRTFTAILFIPTLLIGFLSYQSAQEKISQQLLYSASENVKLVDELITRTLDAEIKGIDFLSQLTSREQLQEKLLVHTRLEQYKQFHPEVSNVYIGTDTGLMLIAPETKLPDGFDPRERPWYQNALKQKDKAIITDPYVDAVTGKVIIGVAKALPDGSGVAAVDLQLDTLEETVKTAKIGKAGYIAVYDMQRKTLVHPVSKPGTDAVGSWINDLYSKDVGQLLYDADGQSMETSFVTNKLTGWKLAGTMYTSEGEEEAKPIFYRTLLVIGITLLVGTVLIYFILRSILRPLSLLIEASGRISEGDLTHQIDIKADDEIGKLGESFNRMTESLRQVLSGVNDSVQQLAASSEELTASAEQTSKATLQIASSIQEVAAGTDQQVNSVRHSSTAITEMSVGIQQIAAHSHSVSNTATHTAGLAQEGNRAIQTAVTQINQIHRTMNGLAEVVESLGDRSVEIGQIVEVITGIAAQTNLLALNAAIEAARAGEQGRGFAVVADEVRKLAEQSSQSAQQIAQLIAAIQAETTTAVQAMETGKGEAAAGITIVDSAGESFREIQQSVSEVAQKILEVSAAAQQMSAGTEQVIQSINQISEVTAIAADGTQNVSAAAEEQLASMEEITSSATSLSNMAEELQELIGKFKM